MGTSELVNKQHLTRKALIYVRQSTPHQVLSNQESLRLQYALKERAQELGWSPENIEIIDADLGLTAATAEQREGFKDLVSQVALDQVGIIISAEVTRLSRNCSDWYRCSTFAATSIVSLPIATVFMTRLRSMAACCLG